MSEYECILEELALLKEKIEKLEKDLEIHKKAEIKWENTPLQKQILKLKEILLKIPKLIDLIINRHNEIMHNENEWFSDGTYTEELAKIRNDIWEILLDGKKSGLADSIKEPLLKNKKASTNLKPSEAQTFEKWLGKVEEKPSEPIDINNLLRIEIIREKGIKIYYKMSPDDSKWISFYMQERELNQIYNEYHKEKPSEPIELEKAFVLLYEAYENHTKSVIVQQDINELYEKIKKRLKNVRTND